MSRPAPDHSPEDLAARWKQPTTGAGAAALERQAAAAQAFIAGMRSYTPPYPEATLERRLATMRENYATGQIDLATLERWVEQELRDYYASTPG